MSASGSALLTVHMPVSSRLEPLCTRNIQSAPNAKKININTCKRWQLMSAAHFSNRNLQQYIRRKTGCSSLMLILFCTLDINRWCMNCNKIKCHGARMANEFGRRFVLPEREASVTERFTVADFRIEIKFSIQRRSNAEFSASKRTVTYWNT